MAHTCYLIGLMLGFCLALFLVYDAVTRYIYAQEWARRDQKVRMICQIFISLLTAPVVAGIAVWLCLIFTGETLL